MVKKQKTEKIVMIQKALQAVKLKIVFKFVITKKKKVPSRGETGQ